MMFDKQTESDDADAYGAGKLSSELLLPSKSSNVKVELVKLIYSCCELVYGNKRQKYYKHVKKNTEKSF